MKTLALPKINLSLLTLIVANGAPLFGVLFFDWDASIIVLLYWIENLIIGSYNVVKMAILPVEHPLMHLGKLFGIAFFSLHFGGFCAVHGAFLLAFFNIGDGIASVSAAGTWPGPLVFLGLLVSVVSALWHSRPAGMEWLVLGLICSHGVSFVQNFIGGKEYLTLTSARLMGRPYARIVLLHVAILAAGIPIMMVGSPVPLVFTLVFLKIGLDIWLHTKSHRVAPRHGR